MDEVKAICEYRYHLDDKAEVIECCSHDKSAQVNVADDTYHVDLGYNVKMHEWHLFSRNMYEYCYTIIIYENESIDGYLSEVRDLCYQYIMRDRQVLERMLSKINTGAVKE